MELNTVDGFHGTEVRILVLSTVRANHSAPDGNNQSRIGFVEMLDAWILLLSHKSQTFPLGFGVTHEPCKETIVPKFNWKQSHKTA